MQRNRFRKRDRDKSLGRDKRFTEPAASSAIADTESGSEGAPAESVERSLFALKALYDRGLIPEDDYRRRKAALEAGNGGEQS